MLQIEQTRSRRWLMGLALYWMAGFIVCQGGEIGFVEKFALAPDREQAISQLIPGTPEYYFYQCLHLQNEKRYDEVEPVLKTWIARHGASNLVQEIENRQILLRYDSQPEESLEALRKRLNLQFNHQADIARTPNLPTRLDPKRINRETLFNDLGKDASHQNRYESHAIEWLIAEKWDALSPANRHYILSQLQRPDIKGLAARVVEDLGYRESRGFGSLPVHQNLLLRQLEEVVRLKSDLLNDSNFVNIYLSKLIPGPATDWRGHTPEAIQSRENTLNNFWMFAERLNKSHNSLKAHILYHRLIHDREQGVYDRDRFLTYIRLPRNAPYMSREYLTQGQSRGEAVNLNHDASQWTQLAPIGSDEDLVRDYLARFILEDGDGRAFAETIQDIYLKRLVAETMLLAGKGDPEKWYSDLPPSQLQALKDRVDLDFLPSNRRHYEVGETVKLSLAVKNAPQMLIKVYEINTANYYRQHGREIDTNIELDGLVANREREPIAYDSVPLRRIVRDYEFPEIQKRGVYVVEFIGSGKSSRALVRVGRLRPIVRTGSGGQILTVVNEKNERVSSATVWLDGQLYESGDDGAIRIPFTGQPGRRPVVIEADGFASLDHFNHEGESYNLMAGFHVDREALIAQAKANVLIRPVLTVNGTILSPKLLDDVRLTIESTDRFDVSATKEAPDFELLEDGESTYAFTVPENLSRIRFTLKGTIKSLREGKPIDLADSAEFTLNGIDKTSRTGDLHLLQSDGEYFIEYLGKTGETLPDRPVLLVFKHRDFRSTVNVSLKTDANGRMALGPLPDIEWIQSAQTGKSSEPQANHWKLPVNQSRYAAHYHGTANQPLRLPYAGEMTQVNSENFSLLMRNTHTYLADVLEFVRIEDGMIVLEDLPAGDYSLFLKDAGREITIRMNFEPDRVKGTQYLLSDSRWLEVVDPAPIGLAPITVDPDRKAIQIRVQNASTYSRVHVFATRFIPAYPLFDNLGGLPRPEPYTIRPANEYSTFVSGRDIGDEYQYILERRTAQKFPGNMLSRPTLLLNPWELRETATGDQKANVGQAWDAIGTEADAQAKRAESQREQSVSVEQFANMDFLWNPSVVLTNLKADEKGLVSIPLDQFGDRHHIHILAVDPNGAVYRQFSLSEPQVALRDLRLRDALTPDKHYTEQKKVTRLKKGDVFEVSDITTSEFEVYDSLTKVYGLYATLCGDAPVAEFAFVTEWPTLDDAKKRSLYSKYACHELNYFLYRKDTIFFEKVVWPYILNKKDKTYLDRWLLGEALDDQRAVWAYNQLNTVERILLSKRIREEGERVSRAIADQVSLIPPNPERFDFLFRTALQRGALEELSQVALGRLGLVERMSGGELFSAINLDSSVGMAGGGTYGGAGGRAGFGMMAPASAAAPARPLADQLALESSLVRSQKGVERGTATLAKAKSESARQWGMSLGDADGDGLATELNLGIVNGVVDDKRLLFEEERRAPMTGESVVTEGVAVDYYFATDALEREHLARQLYRSPEQTREWAENNYYHLPIESQDGSRVAINAFWRDYAAHVAEGREEPFLSEHLAEAHSNFTEVLFALSVLDLPFESPKHEESMEERRFNMTSGGDALVFQQEISPAESAEDMASILVSQNFFRQDDPFLVENGERRDKFVTEEFLTGVVYGARIVITNPTSTQMKVDVLTQIPLGALSVQNGKATDGRRLTLDAYSTQVFDYYFYFPTAGTYPQYPVHVAHNEARIGSAEPFVFNVVDEPSQIDKTSWAYISQRGSVKDIVEFLEKENLYRIDLGRIAWVMKDKAAYQTITRLLDGRHLYHPVLWSYGIKHNDPWAVREYLRQTPSIADRSGLVIDSPLLTLDPVERHRYQHLEYSPLVNARAHRLGREREIVNERFLTQYQSFLKMLTYRARLTAADRLAVTYYLLLQDRVAEAMTFYESVEVDALTGSELQYDYLSVYMAFYREAPDEAEAIARKYAEYPVERWRNRFAEILAQVKEIRGLADPSILDEENRDQQQTQLAAGAPTLAFEVEGDELVITYSNLTACVVNYYEMDLELLFSRNPFVKQDGGQFSFIQPNETQTVPLPTEATTHRVAFPDPYKKRNIMIEVVGGGQTVSQPVYSNSMNVQVIDNYGQVYVTRKDEGTPLSKVYVKVYARMRDGSVQFYKDGYTDLRGRFDYASLSTNTLDHVVRLSLLVLSESEGAAVREANPPRR